MAKCSFAVWRPLPENWTEPKITVTQFVYHTQVGYFGGLYSWFNRSDVYAESHFGLSMGGYLEQYIDTARQADAQYHANIRAISLECEDKGDPIKHPYTDAQLEVMVRLGRWSMEHHPILPRKCPTWDASGFGYHSMWGAPSHWTPVRGKTCPGSTRIRQLETEVFPELFKEIRVAKHAVALIVKDVNGLDAGAAQVLRSRVATLLGMDVPVLGYNAARGNVAHAVLIGDTRETNPRKDFDSYTIFSGENRQETGQVIDALLGGVAR